MRSQSDQTMYVVLQKTLLNNFFIVRQLLVVGQHFSTSYCRTAFFIFVKNFLLRSNFHCLTIFFISGGSKCLNIYTGVENKRCDDLEKPSLYNKHLLLRHWQTMCLHWIWKYVWRFYEIADGLVLLTAMLTVLTTLIENIAFLVNVTYKINMERQNQNCVRSK